MVDAKETIRVGDGLEVTVNRDARNAAKRGEPVALAEEGRVGDLLETRVVKRSGPGVLNGTVDPDASLTGWQLAPTSRGTKALHYYYGDGSVYEMVEFCDSSKCDNCCEHEGVGDAPDPAAGVKEWARATFLMPEWDHNWCPMLQRAVEDPSRPASPPLCRLQLEGGSKEHSAVPLTCVVEPSPQMIDQFIKRFGCVIRYRKVK